MNRRKFLINSIGAAGALSLPFASSVAFSQSRGTYTYLTPMTLSLAFAPILYPSAMGEYEKLGLDVKVEVGRGAGQVIQLVAAKQVESGRTGGANYMAARAKDNSDVVAFATVAQISPFVVISSEEKPVRDVKELEGKIIGMASFGGSMEATLNLMLAKAGIDPQSVRRERVADGPASFAMVEAGRIQAFFGNTSTVSRLRAEDYPLQVMAVDDGVPGQVYVAREADLEANRDQHVTFLKGAREAVLRMADMDDQELLEAIRIIGNKYDVPGIQKEDIALSDLKGNRDLWLAHGKENILRNVPEQWEQGKKLLVSAGLMEDTSRHLYDNDIWEATLA
ncbi:ABC transporter substrate-binding protein [Paenalcaligenes niemegkensis]|uniref:ABC transporter substrate-binding protein n=1 Tax=Paenalcaligenes niemegkensis TaxID=2895469 RepID=UPI001EE9126D|nr:ABC transporter substrate-binding protein [Paenalcaligenes niemegkensis]MCQ9617564.1 ABC transporter substrate-binding protein [Paenalcaligenes niemegkensis]